MPSSLLSLSVFPCIPLSFPWSLSCRHPSSTSSSLSPVLPFRPTIRRLLNSHFTRGKPGTAEAHQLAERSSC
uniref:Putative secreted protein n=1 Tax=Anopheles darlingi TaxID=43151 RepID=A0A2M4DIG9_ANODA